MGQQLPRILSLVMLGLVLAGEVSAASNTDKARSYLAEGKQLAGRGDFAAAVIQFKNAVQNDPDNGEAHFALASALTHSGDLTPVEDELRAAADHGIDKNEVDASLAELFVRQEKFGQLLEEFPEGDRPKDIEARIRTARAYALLNLRRPKEAEQGFESSIALAETGLAQARIIAGDLNGAADLLEKAVAAEPQLIDAWILLGRVRGLQNDLAAARIAFDRAVALGPDNTMALLGRASLTIDSDEKQAAADIAAIFDIQPDNPRANLMDAIIKARHEKWREAQASLMQIPSPEYLPQALFLLARVDLALGEIGQAESNITHYLSLVPTDPAGLGIQATVLTQRGKPGAAIDILHKALAASPDNTGLLGLLSDAYTHNGQPVEAAATLDHLASIAPRDAATRLRLAEQRIAVGRVNEALEDLQIARASEPLSPQATTLAVQTLLAAGRIDDAASLAEEMGRGAPNSPVPETLLGAVAARRGGMQEARQHFEKALALQPDFTTAAIDLAQTYRAEHRFNDARAVYDRILARNPKDNELLTARADLEFADGQKDAGVSWLEQARAADPQKLAPRLQLIGLYLARNEPAKAVAIGRELEQIAPDSAQALTALAEALLANGDRQTAITTLDRVVTLTGGTPEALIRLAHVLVADDKIPAAYALMRKALETNPSDTRVQQALVEFSRTTDNVGATIAFARDLAQSRPEDPAPDELLGQLLDADGKYDEAAQAYAAGAAKGANGLLIRRLAHAQIASGHPDDGAATLTNWLAKQPADTDARAALAATYADAKQLDKGIAEYEKLIAANPKNPVALNNLAMLYLQKGDARAAGTAEQAYKLAPKSPVVADTFGWILLQGGDTEKSVTLLSQALSAGDAPPNIRYHLAAALSKAGKHDDAKQMLSDLLQSGAQFDEIGAAQRLLTDLGG